MTVAAMFVDCARLAKRKKLLKNGCSKHLSKSAAQVSLYMSGCFIKSNPLWRCNSCIALMVQPLTLRMEPVSKCKR